MDGMMGGGEGGAAGATEAVTVTTMGECSIARGG